MKMESLQDLLLHELQDLYSAEQQLLKALPLMSKKASNQSLRSAFNDHLKMTETQVKRLETVFDTLGEKPKSHHCKGMEGLIEEGNDMLKERGDPDTIDAGLIAAAQRVEHYEIAGYGCARTYANMLGHTRAASLLQETLEEEAKTDQLLTQLAESTINVKATE